MNNRRHLKFLFNVSKKKPNSIRNKNTLCPFCDRDKLTKIISEEDHFLLLENKFRTIENTYQTVLVETPTCEKQMGSYSKEYMHTLLSFAFKHWFEMKRSLKYESVILFKNYGPYSGGSMRHAHMQIVGLEDVDYREQLKDEYFEGLLIDHSDNCTLNLSTKPKVGFTEFNVIIDDLSSLCSMGEKIQKVINYLFSDFHVSCDSYNLFFYEWNESYICKIVPRFVTSPMFIGYSLSQVSNQLEDMVIDVQRKCFNKILN